MANKPSLLDTLKAIQAEKIPGRYQRLGNYVVDTFSSWSEYVEKVMEVARRTKRL